MTRRILDRCASGQKSLQLQIHRVRPPLVRGAIGLGHEHGPILYVTRQILLMSTLADLITVFLSLGA
jgi:hypothetical protein